MPKKVIEPDLGKNIVELGLVSLFLALINHFHYV